jgi:hypothetical protein
VNCLRPVGFPPTRAHARLSLQGDLLQFGGRCARVEGAGTRRRVNVCTEGLEVVRRAALCVVLIEPAVYKTLRSASASRGRRRELLYVVLGITHEGILVYTKGALRRHGREEHFYVFVSAKRSVDE